MAECAMAVASCARGLPLEYSCAKVRLLLTERVRIHFIFIASSALLWKALETASTTVAYARLYVLWWHSLRRRVVSGRGCGEGGTFPREGITSLS